MMKCKNLDDWVNGAVVITAMTDVYKTGSDSFRKFYNNRRADTESRNQGTLLNKVIKSK
jgi:hypothetical protein